MLKHNLRLLLTVAAAGLRGAIPLALAPFSGRGGFDGLPDGDG